MTTYIIKDNSGHTLAKFFFDQKKELKLVGPDAGELDGLKRMIEKECEKGVYYRQAARVVNPDGSLSLGAALVPVDKKDKRYEVALVAQIKRAGLDVHHASLSETRRILLEKIQKMPLPEGLKTSVISKIYFVDHKHLRKLEALMA